jgi:sugar lactone lactonase YvrE
VIAPEGKVARTISLPGSDVTNVEFGGKDMKTLYITEAKTGALYTTEVAIGGLPLFRAPQNEVK